MNRSTLFRTSLKGFKIGCRTSRPETKILRGWRAAPMRRAGSSRSWRIGRKWSGIYRLRRKQKRRRCCLRIRPISCSSISHTLSRRKTINCIVFTENGSSSSNSTAKTKKCWKTSKRPHSNNRSMNLFLTPPARQTRALNLHLPSPTSSPSNRRTKKAWRGDWRTSKTKDSISTLQCSVWIRVTVSSPKILSLTLMTTSTKIIGS